jgi:hypothetical protein
MTDAVGSDRLERSYRRLLACYPTDYRARYGEEMIGVLMTASTPQQRRPDAREAFGLITTGLAARLRMTARATYSPAWRDAARVFGFLAAAILAALYGDRAVAVIAHRWSGFYVQGTTWAVAIAWTLAAVAAGLGRRRLAAVGAIAAIVAAAGVTVAVTRPYAEYPWDVVTSWWILVLAVTAAAAQVLTVRPEAEPPGERRRLGPRSRIAVAVAALFAATAPALESFTVVVTQLGEHAYTESYRPPFNYLTLPVAGHRPVVSIALTVLVVLLAVLVLRLSPAVRRRVVLLGLPAAVTQLVVLWTFNGYLQSSPRFDPPVYLVAPQWISLVAVPILVFAFGAWLIARYERRLAAGTLLG